MRKLKRGTNKHKGKLLYKCFNCCRIGHFTSKFPYSKNKNEEKETHKKKGKENKVQGRRKSSSKKKALYSKEENTSNEENSCSDSYSAPNQIVYMTI